MDSANELLDLVRVHRFYVAILEGALGYCIPVPQEVIQQQSNREPGAVLPTFLQWLGMLDLAVSPSMVRDQLQATRHRDSAEALLRYFVRKCSLNDLDRDKADCVLGFLCRHPAAGACGVLEKFPCQADQVHLAAREFNLEIERILAPKRAGELPAEHAQLLREYDFFFQELIDFRTFDQLMDCGILSRIHNLKKSFGPSFYHPQVLAMTGVFNGIFGMRFDDLFLAATRQIKSFAERVQQEGMSIMGRVDGEVRLKHLTELDDEQILGKDYVGAREDFQRVSSFKKAVDKRHGPPTPQASPNGASSAPASPDASGGSTSQSASVTTAFTALQTRDEELKLKRTCEQIRAFVKAADPRVCFTVPLPRITVSLSLPEADAFRRDYGQEKSFRTRYADALVSLVTAKVCVSSERLEFNEKKGSAYRWKPHADSILYLMKIFDALQDQTNELVAAAQQRGLKEKAEALSAALTKLHGELQLATQNLQTLS